MWNTNAFKKKVTHDTLIRAELGRFYGWSLEYIDELSYSDVLEFYEAVTVLQARDRLIDMNIMDYPRMKQESRRKFHRQIDKLANPVHLQKPMEFDEFIEKVNRGR